MPDRLDTQWLDVLAGRAEPAESARLAEALAGDPAAAGAFEGWRRLAAVVREDAAARATGLPSLDGVLAAIRTPAGQGTASGDGSGSGPYEGPTPHDRVGRATLRRLAAEPIVAAGAPRPVPGWVIGTAAVAAAVVLALWPTAHGPLGGVFVAAFRNRSIQTPLMASVQPTPVARLRDAASRLRVGAASSSADGQPAGTHGDGVDFAAGGGAAMRSGGPLDGALGWPPDVVSGSRQAAGARNGRPASARPGAVVAGGSVRRTTGAVPTTDDPAGYPGPGAPLAAYPPPAPPAPAERGGDSKRPGKPPAKPPATPVPEPTEPPPTTPPATATPTENRVVGQIVGADGGGRAQVRVAAYRQEDGPIDASWIETFTADASGRYTLTLQSGTWLLYAEAPGHRPQWWPGADRPQDAQPLQLTAGMTLSVAWQLAAAGDGDGLVVGEVRPHAWVRAVPEGSDPTTTAGPGALADGGGHFALPLPAGRWSVARADDGRDRGWLALPDVVTVNAGTSTSVAWP